MIIFAIFTVFSALLLCGGSQVVDEKFSLYSDIRPVNKSESWHRIRNVPIVNYKITHDGDKTHLGVVGPEAQRWFPESIEVVPTYTFLSKDRSKPPKVVNNFPIVDKNIIFTHGIAALQNLMELFEELQENYRKAAANQSARDSYYSDIEERLQVLLQQEENERASIAVLERELAERQTKLIEVQAEEERKIVELQLKEQQKMLEYEAQLMRERMEYEEKLSRENAANFLEMEKELASKRELLERESAEQTRSQRHEKEKEMAAVEFEHEKAKITAELEARARLGKANQELELNRLKLQAKLDTELYLESIKLIFHQFYKLVQDLVSHPEQLALVAAILASIIAAYYLIKETITFLRHLIQSSIGKPVLVRETSYHWSPFPNIYNKRQTTESSLRDIEKRFDDVILSETDKEKVVNLVLATRNTKKSGAPYRHVLLHGPPGTGKTLIARRLASCSEMDYAIMSGGDVAPLGEDAVNQLHGLFKWASRSKKGLLVFIDEAEAFLASRNGSTASETTESHVRNALNALLYQTGSPSTNFMLVLASNRPADMDSAILDRIDVSLHIDLPRFEERKRMIKLYKEMHVTRILLETQNTNWLFSGASMEKRSIQEDCNTEETLNYITEETDGFSGREISKLFIAIRYSLLLSPESTLTLKELEKVVAAKKIEHRMKQSRGWSKDSADSQNKSVDEKSKKDFKKKQKI